MDGDLGVGLEVDTRAPGGTREDTAPRESLAQITASMAPPSPPAWRRALAQLLHLWLLVLFVVVWELASVLGERLNPQLSIMLPPPTAVFSAAQDLIGRGVLLTHIADSLRRVPLAWIPLSILWFGIGDTQNEYIIFLAAFFPIVLNSMAGARDVDTYLVRAGLSLGARRRDLFLTVVLPASLPNIFTGLRVGLGIGWMALVAGELVAAPTGLGYMINNARTLFRSDYILLGMVLIGLLGLVLDFLMRQVARLTMPWYQGR